MFDVLLFALSMQASTTELKVTATVVHSCSVSAPMFGAVTEPVVGCGNDPWRPLRIRPASTQYGPVFLIDF